jgi:hypothetical protein
LVFKIIYGLLVTRGHIFCSGLCILSRPYIWQYIYQRTEGTYSQTAPLWAGPAHTGPGSCRNHGLVACAIFVFLLLSRHGIKVESDTLRLRTGVTPCQCPPKLLAKLDYRLPCRQHRQHMLLLDESLLHWMIGARRPRCLLHIIGSRRRPMTCGQVKLHLRSRQRLRKVSLRKKMKSKDY